MARNNLSSNSNPGQIEQFVKGLTVYWKEIGTPIRPSEEECLLYDRLIKEYSDGKSSSFLILGATPELRDIALRHADRPVGCDIDARVWEAMKRFMKESGEEEFIHGDWMDMPENIAYDIVLGDCPINMLPDDFHSPLIKKIASLTKKGGMSIMRIGTSRASLIPEVFAKAVDDYRKNSCPISLWRFTIMFAISINNCFYPEFTQREVYEKVLYQYLTKKEIEEIKPFLIDRVFYFPKKEILIKLLTPHFEIKDIIESKGIGCWGMLHTYVLERK
jgi:hypothetical protein